MDYCDHGAIGRAEARAAKDAERRRLAATDWAEVEDAEHERDERTERLRAARLVREAQQEG